MNKRAAIEMSMGTVVTIVLAVVFLILGLTLIRNIYGFADRSMGEIDANLMSQIKQLFPDQDTKVVVYLTDGVAKVRAGTQNFGIAVAARTNSGSAIGGPTEMQYALQIDKDTKNTCFTNPKIGSSVEKWFGKKVSPSADALVYNNIDKAPAGSDIGYARIPVTVPDGTPVCNQPVYIYFIDKTDNSTVSKAGFTSFSVQVLSKGIF